jgi:hypothetical protein
MRAHKKAPRTCGAFSYLVIPFAGVVGSAVPLFVAVPLVPDVDVAWSGVGSVFTPGTPVAPPCVACAGVGLVFTPGTPVAPPWAPVASFCCASAKVLVAASAAANAIVLSFMFVSSWVERKTNRRVVLGSSCSSARQKPPPSARRCWRKLIAQRRHPFQLPHFAPRSILARPAGQSTSGSRNANLVSLP